MILERSSNLAIDREKNDAGDEKETCHNDMKSSEIICTQMQADASR